MQPAHEKSFTLLHANPCCADALKYGFIEWKPRVLPSLEELHETCEVMRTDEEVPCFKHMVKCAQENRAEQGGCCKCDPGWAGGNCDMPLCHPLRRECHS